MLNVRESERIDLKTLKYMIKNRSVCNYEADKAKKDKE